jgi:hypothetical protein
VNSCPFKTTTSTVRKLLRFRNNDFSSAIREPAF